MKETNLYEKRQNLMVVVFGILISLTLYLLFCPVGGPFSGTLSLWDYYTSDILRIFSAFASDGIQSGLTWRRIVIWPCIIGDIVCIYAYVSLNKKINANNKE